MKNGLVLLLLLVSTFSFTQNVVNLSLSDSRTNDVVRNATIKIVMPDTTVSVQSDFDGMAYFILPKGKASIVVSHLKYNKKKRIKKIIDSDDTLLISMELEYIREQDVNEVVVSAPGIPQVVYGSSRVHVSDYEILENGNLILLTYPKQLKKGSELLVYNGEKVISNFEIEYKAKELIHDYRGNAHIVCEEKVLGIHMDKKTIGLSILDRNYYMRYISPIVDSSDTKLYFSNYSDNYPAFDYFTYDQSDSTYSKILGITDELMMELYRSEIKWVDVRTRIWAKNKERETGVDAEVIVGANYFTQSLYYKELYAPLFYRNDTVFVFDYYKDELKYFDNNGNVMDSVPIYHHYNKRKTGWKAKLTQDRVTGQIYGLYERAGYTYVGFVDVKTGEIKEQVKLKNRYANEIQINGNYVYYIYRPYESAQKKYLYKERLPYDFGGAVVLKEEVVFEEGL